jgi:hypothetical protein
MPAIQKKPAFDFKTQYGLGPDPQDVPNHIDGEWPSLPTRSAYPSRRAAQSPSISTLTNGIRFTRLAADQLLSQG